MPIKLINLFWLVQTTQSPGMNIKQAANHKHLIIASQINSTCATKKNNRSTNQSNAHVSLRIFSMLAVTQHKSNLLHHKFTELIQSLQLAKSALCYCK